MTAPHNPHFGNVPPPPPGPGNMPPQLPPQPGMSPDQYFQDPNFYPPGFNPIDVNIWGDGPVSFPVSARPPQIGHAVVRNRAKGRYIHEERARQKTKAAEELYAQRGSEQFFGFMPRVGRFLGRVAFKGTTTPPEKIQAGHQRKEVGWATRWLVAAPLGAIALVPAVVSKGILMPIRFSSNYFSLGRTAKDSLKPVVPKRGEGPRDLRGNVPAQSVYKNPYPKLGGNLPTSPKQARANKRNTRKQARQQPPQQQVPPAQQAPQPQRTQQAQPNQTQPAPNRGGSRRKPQKSGRQKQQGII